MSQVLARKWRPQSFDQLIGQSSTVQALQNALKHNRLHHAYLFTGTRGVGKTTLARIIAMCLNCEQQITHHPCGQCLHCQSIRKGHHIDVIEVDAASRTKVEDTREILDNVHYAPNQARFKIYIIDEIHMLSTHSFNALLKTLEEPPQHVKFLFATTDPQKIPATVLSRCMQLHLESIDMPTLSSHFQSVLTQEKIPFETAALDAIAHAASGSVRDGLSLLDQAIALCHGHTITTDAISKMLGTLSETHIQSLITHAFNQSAQQALELAHTLIQTGAHPASILKQILHTLHAMACHISIQTSPAPFDLSHLTTFSTHTPTQQLEWVHLLYQIALSGQRDLPFAPTPQQGLDITLLRMSALMPETPEEATLPWHQTEPNKPLSTFNNHISSSQLPPHQETQNTPKRSPTSTPLTPPPSQHEKPNTLCAETWHQWVEYLGLPGMTQSLLAHTGWKTYQDNVLTLTLHQKHHALISEKRTQTIENSFKSNGFESITIVIETHDTSPDSLQHRKALEAAEKPKKALKALEQDETLQTLLSTFDGTLKQPELKTPSS